MIFNNFGPSLEKLKDKAREHTKKIVAGTAILGLSIGATEVAAQNTKKESAKGKNKSEDNTKQPISKEVNKKINYEDLYININKRNYDEFVRLRDAEKLPSDNLPFPIVIKVKGINVGGNNEIYIPAGVNSADKRIKLKIVVDKDYGNIDGLILINYQGNLWVTSEIHVKIDPKTGNFINRDANSLPLNDHKGTQIGTVLVGLL